MRKSRFSEEQIIGMIREHEAGVKTADICRKYGISDATFYKYKAKFGGMTVSDARRLKTLEEENSKLKRLLADAMLDKAALKDLLAKNSAAGREARSCGSSPGLPWDERAAGVPGHRYRSQGCAVPFHAGR